MYWLYSSYTFEAPICDLRCNVRITENRRRVVFSISRPKYSYATFTTVKNLSGLRARQSPRIKSNREIDPRLFSGRNIIINRYISRKEWKLTSSLRSDEIPFARIPTFY